MILSNSKTQKKEAMKNQILVMIAVLLTACANTVNAQGNLFWGQTETHFFENVRSTYGVASYEHYFENNLNIWGFTAFDANWAKVIVGLGYSHSWDNGSSIELDLGTGYQTGLSRPRFASILYGSFQLDDDKDSRKGMLEVLYNPEYGSSFYHFGFVLYNATDWLQVGMMLQPDGATGPRVQLNLGPAGELRPWVAYGYATDFHSWGWSIGMRYKIFWNAKK